MDFSTDVDNLTDTENQTLSIFDNRTDLEGDRWPGAVMVLYSSVCIFSYLLCLITVVSEKQLWKMPSFRIILHIGIVDIFQLFLNGIIGGIFSMCQNDFNFYFNKICGGIMNSNWIIYVTMADLLSWNRCLQIYRPDLAKKIFTLKNTKIILTLCWIYGLAWIVAHMCPDFDVYYRPQLHYWDFDGLKEKSIMLDMAELINDCTHCASMTVSYAAVICKMIIQAKQISDNQLNTDKKEKLVLLQSLWICAVTIFTDILFFFNTRLIPNNWAYFLSTMVWLTCAGSNGFIYIIFNKRIRNKVTKMIKCNHATVTPFNP